MAPTFDIPGYYYDQEKKRFFKIEKSHTAPSSAAWSSDNVKKRRLEDEEATKATERMTLNKSRVARANTLQHPLMGGFLDGEFGRPRLEVVSAGFAQGLVDKGKIPLKDARWTTASNVNRMYIDGQDGNTDMCVAFATTDEQSLISSYIPRDKSGLVHRRLLAHYQTPVARVAPYHELAVPQISDIKYHQPSNRVLITSRSPGQDALLWAFTPKEADVDLFDTNRRPRWLLGWAGSPIFRRINTQGDLRHHDYQSNTVAPGLPNSNQVCAIGTNRGVIRWVADGYREWLTPKRFAPKEHNPYTDIFALDYQCSHPDVILFGGRPGNMYISDHRLPRQRWGVLASPSPIIHVKSVNEHQVLVAGLRDNLSLYDLRFFKRGSCHHDSSPRNKYTTNNPTTNNNNTRSPGTALTTTTPNPDIALPLLTFPRYRNRAYIDVGLDVDTASGIVAAAHEDGTVMLHSLRSGNWLRSPEIDKICSSRGPVRAVQFQAFPRDRNPSLFVGVHSNVNVYSFGVGKLEDED